MACVADVGPLMLPATEQVTVRLEGFQGPVTLLFSGPDGQVLEVADVQAPTVLERWLPQGSAVSTRFMTQPFPQLDVVSIGDLMNGDDVTLRPPRPWQAQRRIELPAQDDLPEGIVQINYGCGAMFGYTMFPALLNIDEDCLNDPMIIAASLGEGADRLITTLLVPLENADPIVAPRFGDFDTPMRSLPVTIYDTPVGRGPGSLTVTAVIGNQSFHPFAAPLRFEAEPIVEVSAPVYPLDYESLALQLWLQEEGSNEVTMINQHSTAPQMDASTALPRLTELRLGEERMAWTAEGSTTAADLTIVQYGTSQGTFLTPDVPVNGWTIVRRSSQAGQWRLPELPPRLESWRPPDAPDGPSSVTLIELPSQSPEQARRDPFAPAPQEQRRIQVHRFAYHATPPS